MVFIQMNISLQGKVHKLLQSEESAADIPDDQYRTVQVRMATIDQFKKMGISFVDDSPNGKRYVNPFLITVVHSLVS